jgi:hypothetical protein
MQAPMPLLVVNAIHVYVTQPNGLGIPIGSQYVVAHALSALKPNVSGVLSGHAYGHKLFEGGRAQSGPSAVVYLSCVGTGGKVIENTQAAVMQAPAFQLGEIKDTAGGKITSKKATAETTSTIQAVNLLGGLITADLIKADARGSKKGRNVALSDRGSRFVNLVVAGRPIGNETGPNKSVPLPGIGTLWLHRVIRTGNTIEVRMLDLAVEESNPFGLTPGSKLQLAVAHLGILP